MIYCGYSGCGKTTYCLAHPDTAIDLDSTHWEKVEGWEKEYINHALSLSKDKDVFISAHYAVIEYCRAQNIPFTIIAPACDRQEWQSRLEFRFYGCRTLSNWKALADFEMNFERDIEYYNRLQAEGIPVKWITAKVITNIGDFITRE